MIFKKWFCWFWVFSLGACTALPEVEIPEVSASPRSTPSVRPAQTPAPTIRPSAAPAAEATPAPQGSPDVVIIPPAASAAPEVRPSPTPTPEPTPVPTASPQAEAQPTPKSTATPTPFGLPSDLTPTHVLRLNSQYAEAVLMHYGAHERRMAPAIQAMFEVRANHNLPGITTALQPGLSDGSGVQSPASLSEAARSDLLQAYRHRAQLQSQSMQTLQTSLQALNPDPDFQSAHQHLLDTAALEQALFSALSNESEAVQGQVFFEASTSHPYTEQLAGLQAGQAPLRQHLLDLQLSLTLQTLEARPAREDTDATSYPARLKSLITNPRQFTPPAFVALMTEPGSPEQKQAYLQQSLSQHPVWMEALAQINPPAAYLRFHAVLHRFLGHETVILQHLPESILQNENHYGISAAQLADLYANAELVEHMFFASLLMNELVLTSYALF